MKFYYTPYRTFGAVFDLQRGEVKYIKVLLGLLIEITTDPENKQYFETLLEEVNHFEKDTFH